MRKAALCGVVVLSAVSLSACGPNPNTTGGTVIGALAGGLLGSQFGGGSGRIVGAVIGAAAGAYIGNRIGQYMDRQDRMNYEQAATTTPVNQRAVWTNHQTKRTYYVEPTRQYRRDHKICRRVKTTVQFENGRTRDAWSTVCRYPGSKQWHFESA